MKNIKINKNAESLGAVTHTHTHTHTHKHLTEWMESIYSTRERVTL